MEKIRNSWFKSKFTVVFKEGDTVYKVVKGVDKIDFTKPVYLSNKELYIIIAETGIQV